MSAATVEDFFKAPSGVTITVENDADYPWTVGSDGRMQSNMHEANHNTSIKFTNSSAVGLVCSFTLTNSGEGGCDYIFFETSDGTSSGYVYDTESDDFSATLAAGQSITFTWRKDGSEDQNDDCGYVSDMVFEEKQAFVDKAGNSWEFSATDDLNNCRILSLTLANESISSVVMPSAFTFKDVDYTVKGFAPQVFRNRNNLTSITIPNTVTNVENYSFQGCHSLDTLSLPNSLVWNDCWQSYYDMSANHVNITFTDEADLMNYIQNPGRYDERRFYEAENMHLYVGGKEVTEITIPDAVTQVGDRAFYNCRNITSVQMPQGIQIGTDAFVGTATKYAHIGESGEFTDKNGLTWGFNVCTNADGVELTYYDGSVSSLTVPSVVSYAGFEWNVVGLTEWLFNSHTEITSVTLPETLVKIDSYAFNDCTALTNIEIPESVTTVGEYIFNGCYNMKTLSLHNSITSYYWEAFCGCDIQDVNVLLKDNADFVKYLSNSTDVFYLSNIRYRNHHLYIGGVEQTEVVVPEGVSSLPYSAFYYFVNVEAVTLPSTMESIGSEAFSYMSSLSKLKVNAATPPTLDQSLPDEVSVVYVPKGSAKDYRHAEYWSDKVIISGEGVAVNVEVKTPGKLAENILDVLEEEGYDNFHDVNYLTVKGKLNEDDLNTIKESLSCLLTVDLKDIENTELLENQFSGKTSLRSAVLPKNLVSVPYEAFYEDHALEKVVIQDGTREICSRAFCICKVLNDVSIPNSVTSIGHQAFGLCYKLKEVTLPPNLKAVDTYLFSYCYALEKVKLPSNVESIGEHAFADCYSLKSVELNEGLKRIEYYAFGGCTGLSEFVLPSSLVYVNNSFEECNSVSKVTCYALVPPSVSDDLGFNSMNATLYVPEITLKKYKLAGYWSEFETILPIENYAPEKFNIVNGLFEFSEKMRPDNKPAVAVSKDDDMNTRGHLEVSGESSLALGDFSTLYNYYNDYNDSWYVSEYGTRENTYFPTVLSNSPVTADKVSVTARFQTGRWTFFSLPFDANVSAIETSANTQWVIRTYSGEERANGNFGNTWKVVDDDAVLKANVGYILQCVTSGENDEEEVYYNYADFVFHAVNNGNKNNVFTNADVDVLLDKNYSEFPQNKGWNLVGNPYACYFDTHSLSYSSPITVWDPNTCYYKAYSPLDDDYVLLPGESFFVQCPDDSNVLTFHAAGRMHYAFSESEEARGNVSRSAAQSSRQVFNIKVANETVSDKARFVINEAAKTVYDPAMDASKFDAMSAKALQVYVLANNIKYAIDERPLGNGTVDLGLCVPAAGSYKLSLNTASGSPVTLVDHLLNTTQDITSKAYEFESEAGTFNSRFTLVVNSVATDIESVNTDADADAPVYNVGGQRVSSSADGILIKNGHKVVK